MDIAQAVDVARQAVEAGSRASMRYFRKEFGIDYKADRTPVTQADQESEDAILAVLREAYPDFDVLAEESGLDERGSEYRWIVDPLDGTKGFSRGTTFWGPLVALQHGEDTLVGAAALPACDETYYAGRGVGAFCNGERLQVSTIDQWQDATLSLGEMTRLLDAPYRDAVIELGTSAYSARCYGDLAGAMLVLQGRAEVWIEAGVKIWDVAPMRVLIEEAGGKFTDLAGGQDLTRGDAICSNGRLHEHVASRLGS